MINTKFGLSVTVKLARKSAGQRCRPAAWLVDASDGHDLKRGDIVVETCFQVIACQHLESDPPLIHVALHAFKRRGLNEGVSEDIAPPPGLFTTIISTTIIGWLRSPSGSRALTALQRSLFVRCSGPAGNPYCRG